MPNYRNHLTQGYKEVTFKGKKVISSMNSESFKGNIDLVDIRSGGVGVIPPGYEHRADKIADLFYGDASLDWVVLWTNNISDPFEQLRVGDRIRIIDLA